MYVELTLEMDLPDNRAVKKSELEAALIAVIKGYGGNVKMVRSYDGEHDSIWSYNVDPDAVVPMYLTDRP